MASSSLSAPDLETKTPRRQPIEVDPTHFAKLFPAGIIALQLVLRPNGTTCPEIETGKFNVEVVLIGPSSGPDAEWPPVRKRVVEDRDHLVCACRDLRLPCRPQSEFCASIAIARMKRVFQFVAGKPISTA